MMNANEAKRLMTEARKTQRTERDVKILKAKPKAEKRLANILKKIERAARRGDDSVTVYGSGLFASIYSRMALTELLIGLGYAVYLQYNDDLRIYWGHK